MFPESMKEVATIWKTTRELALETSEESASQPESLPLERIQFGMELSLTRDILAIAVNLIIVAHLVAVYMRDKKKDREFLEILKKDVESRQKALETIVPLAVECGVGEEQAERLFAKILT